MTTGGVAARFKPNLSPRRGGRRRAPTVLQMEATECGAACLAMILASHGRWIPLESLRVACGVSRDGSRASNIVRAARELGLAAQGFRREPGRLLDLPFPMILFWNFNHFVVLEGIRGKRAYLNDPASGPRVVSLAELDACFTGVVLAFAPTPAFRREGRPPSAVAGLRRRLAGNGGTLFFILLVSVALVVPGLVGPAFTKVFVDEVLVRGSDRWLTPLLLGMGITAAMRFALATMQHRLLARAEIKLAISAAARFVWHMLHLPTTFFSQRYAGDLASRVSANDRVAQLISGELATSTVNLISLLFFGAVMLGYEPVLALIGFAGVAANALALRLVAGARGEAASRIATEQGKLAAVSIAGVQSVETLKAMGSESDFFVRWAGTHANLLAAQHRLDLLSYGLQVGPTLITSLTTAAVLGWGGLLIVQGSITVGGLVAFQSLLQSFSTPVEGLVRFGGSLQTVRSDLGRLDDVLAYERDAALDRQRPPTATRPKAEPMPKLTGAVELVDVTFGYSLREPPLIKGFNLSVRPGQRIALVGGSGSGKSTLARLVCGIFQPWSGEIRFDGRPAQAIPRAQRAAAIAYVDQEIVLFAGTVRDNLTLWDDTVPETALTRSLRDAALHDLIASRPGRQDGRVDEGGLNFSGGQRQRLEIARALATDPSILVLDEATAALDPLTELAIDKRIRRRGCTCLIVAHRLSTIRDADEIIVLERGEAVQRGQHDTLLAAEGLYRTLITSI